MKRTKDFFFPLFLPSSPSAVCVPLSLSFFLFLLLFRSLIDGLAAQRTIKAPEIKRQHERERKKKFRNGIGSISTVFPHEPLFCRIPVFFLHLSFNFQFASVSFLRFGKKMIDSGKWRRSFIASPSTSSAATRRPTAAAAAARTRSGPWRRGSGPS